MIKFLILQLPNAQHYKPENILIIHRNNLAGFDTIQPYPTN
jgi:hypothetical protein